MTIDNKLFDDLTRVAGGAVSVLSAVGKQLGEGLKDQMGDKFSSFPSSFSPSSFSSAAANDDAERLMGVVTKLRMEQEELKARIAVLESMLGISSSRKPAAKSKNAPAKKMPAKKVAAKKPAAKKSAKKPAKKRA